MSTITAAPRASLGKRFLRDYGQEVVIIAAIAALFVVVGLYNPRFLSDTNLSSIFISNAYVAVAAIGMSMVMIAGHIDVSVGAMIGVLAVLSGTLAVNGYPLWIAWTLPVVAGIAASGLIGALIAYGRIPSIVATLGMMSILKGGLISITGGVWISGLPAEFALAKFELLGVPAAIWFMAILTLLATWWLGNTPLGRTVYAVGGNPEAAEASGIRIRHATVFVFLLHGLFVGIAAILFATQFQVIQSTVPANLELTIITASVVGGVSILGGMGTVIGSTLAAILFATIASSMIFLNVSAYWLRSIQGLLILATVLADILRRRKAM